MEYVDFSHVPELEDALLIGAFAGWNDAATAGTWAIRFLMNQWKTEELATIDAEPFFDYTESRPRVRITNGSIRRVTWPSIVLHAGKAPIGPERRPRDVVLLSADEPQLRWKSFTRALMEVCARCNVTELALLGALVGEVAHTSPVKLLGTSTEQGLLRRMDRAGVERATYEGPTGILTVVHDAARHAGIATSSLWGMAPHYVSATPNLPVAQALLDKLNTLYRLDLKLGDLTRAARRFTQRVSTLVAADPAVSAYVRQLEERTPEDESSGMPLAGDVSGVRGIPPSGELPTPEEAVKDVEEWLRQFRDDTGQDS